MIPPLASSRTSALAPAVVLTGGGRLSLAPQKSSPFAKPAAVPTELPRSDKRRRYLSDRLPRVFALVARGMVVVGHRSFLQSPLVRSPEHQSVSQTDNVSGVLDHASVGEGYVVGDIH